MFHAKPMSVSGGTKYVNSRVSVSAFSSSVSGRTKCARAYFSKSDTVDFKEPNPEVTSLKVQCGVSSPCLLYPFATYCRVVSGNSDVLDISNGPHISSCTRSLYGLPATVVRISPNRPYPRLL